MSTAVLITAAGSSRRFNSSSENNVKKEFLCIDALPVLCRAIRPFLQLGDLAVLAITYREGELEAVRDMVFRTPGIEDLNDLEVLFVKGGATRQESVFNGLKAINSCKNHSGIEIIGIHDGARPFVDFPLISACFEAAQRVGGSCPCIRATDTLVHVDADNLLDGRIPREGVCTVQTPQCFRFPDILRAHEAADPKKAYTDDTEIFMDWGGKVAFVQGNPKNRKITYATDLSPESAQSRIGTGWDLHRLEAGRPLVLGGVRIESPKGCVGHSDGDALIHAVIDSILGAAGLPDIGTLFPDTDPAYKEIDSAVLLEKVVALVESKGFSIVNVDSTVILQSPKLGPYKQPIRERMASLLGVPFDCFDVKAKTAEHILNELGTGDAVACQSICLLSISE